MWCCKQQFSVHGYVDVCYIIYVSLLIVPDFGFSYSFIFSFLSCNAYIPMFTPEAISLFEDGYCIGGNVPEFWWHPVPDDMVETEICYKNDHYLPSAHKITYLLQQQISISQNRTSWNARRSIFCFAYIYSQETNSSTFFMSFTSTYMAVIGCLAQIWLRVFSYSYHMPSANGKVSSLSSGNSRF